MKHWIRTNQGMGATLFVLAAALFAYLWFQPWSGRVMRDGFTLGFFPLLGVGAIIACSLLLMVDGFRREVPEDFSNARLIDIPIIVGMVVAIFTYFHASRLTGFVIATPFYLFAFMFVLGTRPLHIAGLAAIGLTITIYVLFRLLGIDLPRGPLPF